MWKELTNLEKIYKKHKDLILTLNTVLMLILFTIYGGFWINGWELLMWILLTVLLISIPINYIFLLFYNIIKSFWENIWNEENTIKWYKISFWIISLVMIIIYSFLYIINLTIKIW